jgi:hypothetical protein
MSLEMMAKENLPLNRKERFFTGTVFPMIVCRDNFAHFHHFLKLMGVTDPIEINAGRGSENIQFFTEYSFVESISDKDRKRFPNPPILKDTPDILVLVNIIGKKILIAIEAKMYDLPTANDLKDQMDRQRHNILDYLEKRLAIDELYHLALLPNKLSHALKNDGFDYPAITWETISSQYQSVYGDDYFLNILELSLANYDELVSRKLDFRKNCGALMKGQQIYNDYENGTLKQTIMGRNGGIGGDVINDIIENRWPHHQYETSSEANPFNRNWFPIKKFVELVDTLAGSK